MDPDSIIFLTANFAGPFRTVMVDGKEWRVVPGVLMVEGVHSANNGDLYYPAPELEKSVPELENELLVLNHPMIDGKPVPIDMVPGYYDDFGIGDIRKVEWNGKLKSEYWFDMERADKVDSRIRQNLDEGKPMGTSIGIGHEIVKKESSFNGTPYKGIVQGIVSDHVALLLDKPGACDIKKGCGCGATFNQANELLPLTANEMSFDRISRQVSAQLEAKFGYYAYIRDIYSDFVVYTGKDGQLFKLPYSTSKDVVTLADDSPVKVKYVTEYRTESGNFVGNCSCSILEDNNVDKKAQIAAIIANGTFTEADRAWLEGQPDDKIVRLHKGITANAAPVVAPPQPAPVPPPAPARQLTFNEWLDTLPPEKREEEMEKQQAGEKLRTDLIGTITANMKDCPAGTLSEEYLKRQPLKVLQVMAMTTTPKAVTANAAPPAPNYGGLAVIPPVTANQAPPAAYVPPTLFAPKK